MAEGVPDEGVISEVAWDLDIILMHQDLDLDTDKDYTYTIFQSEASGRIVPCESPQFMATVILFPRHPQHPVASGGRFGTSLTEHSLLGGFPLY